ncbi:MAG: polysaccharide deacetylase family protein, partial [Bryobacterales bacterium]|nr:polysaccharide deacetylase family protein [Bryobacterales bacterium]
MLRRQLLTLLPAPLLAAPAPKTVVLTFDDAVMSHRTFVGPLLRELGFRATFFVTHRWMPDKANFMTWMDIAELHAMGFEIGNHSWTHADFSTPRGASRLEAELSLVEYELNRVKVPKPVSFAWCGNTFGPESMAVLTKCGYKFARRGGAPEVEYGKIVVGPALDVTKHHPLLIPTTGD